MKKIFLAAVFAATAIGAQAQPVFPRSQAEDTKGYMSEAYWKIWNEEEQARIDADIEKYRKADGEIVLENIGRNREVKIEQVSHEFIFGAHIFHFNQLGKSEYNDRYKRAYGELFNSATLPFYWREFEWEQGKLRFATEEHDTEEWWNACKEPKSQFHWRRPSTDQIVDFCEKKGIRAHGHILIWGNRQYQQPRWVLDTFTAEERARFNELFPNEPNRRSSRDKKSAEWEAMSFDEAAAAFPEYTKTMAQIFENRIKQIAERYKGRVQSWDVVNESALCAEQNYIPENFPIAKSRNGLMPGDFPYRSFKWAEQYFPKEVKLNINDFHRKPAYTAQVKRLLERGCKIDIMGIQMHLFDTKLCQGIAEGELIQTPSQVREYIGWASETGLPIHISEVTITAPTPDERGLIIQGVIAQQLYRLWFSQRNMMGVTWWNTVDGCGAAHVASSAGLFNRDMSEKPAYYALDQLINHEWKTNITVKADENGKVQFRGFKGKYRITYKDKRGKTQVVEYTLK